MTAIWTGLSVGAIYAVVAMAFNVGFVTSGVFNFAQPQFVVLGTFGTYWLLASVGLPTVVVIVLVLIGVVIIGFVQEQVSIRPIADRTDHSSAIVTTVGASTMIGATVLLIWGSNPLAAPILGDNNAFSLIGGRIQPVDAVLIGFAVVSAIVLELVSNRTTWGLANRAVAENREAAALRGVNARRMVTVSFMIAALLAGLLGVLSVTKTYALFSLGDFYVVKAFAALAMFGFGSQKGALAGGFLVGLIEALTSRYIGTEYSNIAVFVVLLVVLMARPRGLFGVAEGRVV
jgi:branched-chain amino acid transport system permease protein